MGNGRATQIARGLLLLTSLSLASAPLYGATPSRTAKAAKARATKPASKPSVKHSYSARASQARRAKLAHARAAALARDMQALSVPKFKVNDSGVVVPDVRAEAAIIYNPDTKQVLWEEHSQDKRSIASITKVMTATCVFAGNPDLEEQVVIDRSDVHLASTTYLKAGERVKIGDLLHLMLIGSDNGAARALARTSPGGMSRFIERMNEKAAALTLGNTSYVDPSGLDASNMSSAYDMARLITYAASDDRISGIMRTAEYTFRTSRRPITVHSTNQLVRRGDIDVLGGKTGFISKAGYCLATLLKLPGMDQQVAVVVLGARSNAGRFMETRHLFNWLESKAGDLFRKPETQQQ